MNYHPAVQFYSPASNRHVSPDCR